MKVTVTVMYRGKKSNLEICLSNKASVKDINKLVEEESKISLSNAKLMYNKVIIQKDSTTLEDMSYKEGIPIIILARAPKTVRNATSKTAPASEVKVEEKQLRGPSCEPLVFKEKMGPTPKEIFDSKMLCFEQLMSFGVKEDLAWRATEVSNGNFEQAHAYVMECNRKRNQCTLDSIKKIRNILIEKPYRLELFVQLAENNDPDIGYKSRYNPEEFLRDLHLDPKFFPCDEIRAKSISREKAMELTTIEEIDVRDIVEMGFDRDVVVNVYLNCDSNKEKTVDFLLNQQNYIY